VNKHTSKTENKKRLCHRECSLSFVNPHQPRESRRLVFDQRLTIYNLSSINSSARFCHDGTNNVETFFRTTLAYIQIRENGLLTKENLISFIKARVKGIIKKVGNERSKWKSIVQSGIPLTSDLFLESKLFDIALMLPANDIEKTIDLKIEVAKSIIKIIDKIPVLEENTEELRSPDFNDIITKWLKTESISSLMELESAEEIITNVFSYKLPWIFNGISKKLRNIELQDEAQLIEEISLLLETGLPNLKTVKIYQAGIRSRVYAKECSLLFEDELWDKTIRDYKKDILNNRENFKNSVSEKCGEWIDLLFHMSNIKRTVIDSIPDFTFGDVHEKTNTLIAKEINGKKYLFSPDFSFVQEISESTIDFSSINGIQGIIFIYDIAEELWKMKVENPHLN
jgi:hypothetical protein